jgi:hypothetical protein
MRNLLITALLIFISLSTFSQNFPLNSNGEVEYSKVIEVPGTSDELYGKVKMFVGENFISAKDVIKTDDDLNKQMVVKGNIVNLKKGMYPVEFTCNIQFIVWVKDNKVKYKLNPLNLNSQMYSFAGNTLNRYDGAINEKPKNGVVVSKSNWEAFQTELQSDFERYLSKFEQYLRSSDNDF